MDLLGLILGWNWKLQRTRRRWDRLREHALERKGRVRHHALKELDDIEDNLRMLEEERLSRRDRTRMLREIQMELSNIEDVIEKGEAWIESERRAEYSKEGFKKQEDEGKQRPRV
jgi:hypothetical protein